MRKTLTFQKASLLHLDKDAFFVVLVGFGFLDFCLLGSGHRVGDQQYACKVYLFVCILGCSGSSLLCTGFLQLW